MAAADATAQAVREAWLAPALSEEPTDRRAAEEAIAALYACAGLPAPATMWTGSIISGAVESQRLLDASEDADVGRLVGAPIVDRLLASSRATIVSRAARALDPATGEPLARSVGAWLRIRLEGAQTFIVAEAARVLGGPRQAGRVPGQLSLAGGTWQQALCCGGGWSDSPWLAPADAASRLGISLGPDAQARLDALTVLAGTGGWWPFERLVVIAERPLIRLDADGRPHGESGPAICYPDWRLFAWHGRRVDGEGLDPSGPISLERVLGEDDPDLQRLLINRYGVADLRRDARAVPIDHDRFGTLWRLRLPGREWLAMVEVVNSTPEPDGTYRRYNLRVPPEITSSVEAVAWTFGLTAREYRARLQAQT